MSKRFFLLALLLSCFWLLHAQVPEELTVQSQSIREKLLDLKVNSEVVTQQLQTLSENLKVSQAEAKAWEQQSTRLSESLMTINEQLNESYESLVTEKLRTKRLTKGLVTFIGIFTFLLLIKIIFIVFYVKGIKVPRFIDILA